ncbi:MAG: protein phosphatase [Rhodobacteraceae bacterium]|nr:protein phosphatase [Paracoccaceae bacterium]
MGFAIRAISADLGEIAISPLPGRFGAYPKDFRHIARWAPNLVLSMTTLPEMDRAGASGLPVDLATMGCKWRHLPVADFGTPKDPTGHIWSDASGQARQVLASGGRVLVHCRGGCGRSGMAIVRILVDMGEPAEIALTRLRAVRGCAVETQAQMRWAGVS